MVYFEIFNFTINTLYNCILYWKGRLFNQHAYEKRQLESQQEEAAKQHLYLYSYAEELKANAELQQEKAQKYRIKM